MKYCLLLFSRVTVRKLPSTLFLNIHLAVLLPSRYLGHMLYDGCSLLFKLREVQVRALPSTIRLAEEDKRKLRHPSFGLFVGTEFLRQSM